MNRGLRTTSKAACWAFAALLITSILCPVCMNPIERKFSGVFNEPVNECPTNDEILTLCQRCAKQTQSNIVYPMCCKGQEEARSWCESYLAFGQSPNS